MKTSLIGLSVSVLLALTLVCGAGEKRDFMLIGRDYNLWDDMVSVHPISAGLNSWTDKEYGTVPALFGSIALFSYKDIVRLECGGTITWHKNNNQPDIAMLSGISTLIKERIVLGIWMSPFWNLYEKNPDDPWGVMIGYVIPLGGK